MVRTWPRRINLLLIALFGTGLAWYWLWSTGGAFFSAFRYDALANSPFSTAPLGRLTAAEAQTTSPARPVLREPLTLHIPKIGVKAPIVQPADESAASVLASLESDVGLYPDSVPLGTEGRAILLGHSSRASWYRGSYAHVFSILTKLETGDEFYIEGAEGKLLYRVFETLTLSPEETNRLMNKPARGSELDLVTCYPVGSASKRTPAVRAQSEHPRLRCFLFLRIRFR